jgi:ubiquinone/menaquinone biosynthesis C-methylase UbiE
MAARGHRVTGVDLATQMLAEARRKAAAQDRAITFKEADAENTGLPAASVDLVISRHVLWTLPHPEAAIDEWLRVLRPGGRLVIIDGAQYDNDAAPPPRENARASTEYADITDKLPFFGGRPRDDVETLLRARNLTGIGADPLLDLIAAQGARAQAEGRTIRRRQRYVVWGDVPK